MDGRMEIMMKYRHIVFDVDGTLLDTAQCILVSLRDALKTTDGISMECSDLAFALGNPSMVTLKTLNVKDPDATLALWVENEERYINMMRLFDGIPELLDQLKDAGITLGIVTSRSKEEFDLVFKNLNIAHLFSAIVCADDTKEHKPSPAPLLKYMERTGAEAADVLYIGDSLHDSMCASAAGAHFAHAVWGAHEVHDVPAEYYPGNPAQLSQFISDN